MKGLFHGPVILLVSFLIISCTGRLALGPEAGVGPGWITAASDFGRTSYRPDARLTAPLKELWKAQFVAGVAEAPVLRGEIAFVPLLNGEVVALSVSDGARLGRRKFSDGAIAGLSVAGRRLYVTAVPGRTSVLAYDLVRGRTLWKKRMGEVVGSPAVSTDRLLVTGLHGDISSLRGDDGEVVWETRERAAVAAAGAVGSGFLVTGYRDGAVVCRQAESGRLVWKRDLRPEHLYSHPVICGDRVLVTSLAGSVHALNLREGTPVWIWKQDDPLYSSVSCDTTSVYVSSTSGKIYRLSLENGRVQWAFDTGELVNQEVAVSDTNIVAVTARGDIVVISKASGRDLWRARVKGRIIIPPVLHGGLLVVADDKKWVYGFGPSQEEREDP